MSNQLPSIGSANWGQPLDNYINSVLSVATAAQSTVSTHQNGVDPHGDRAYTNRLFAPITSGTNQANGYVVIGGNGLIPNNLLPSAGGQAGVFDVSSSTYGGVGNGTNDDTSAIQAALNAAAVTGGEVWIPAGTWEVSSTLIIGNNTWLHLSPGAVINRKINAGTGLLPTVLVSNFATTTALSSITGNIQITGGKWDSTNGGTQATACTIFQLANATFMAIEQTILIGPQNNAAIQLFGVNDVVIRDTLFSGYTPTLSLSSITAPAVQVSQASSAELPAGLNSSMYTNTPCTQISLSASIVDVPIGGYKSTSGLSVGGYGYLMGSPVVPSSASHAQIAIEMCSVNGLAHNLLLPNGWMNVILGNSLFNLGWAGGSSPSVSTANLVQDSAGIPTIKALNNTLKLDVEQWASVGLSYPFSGSINFRLNVTDRTIDVSGALTLPGSGYYNNISFVTLPYAPVTQKRWPCLHLSQESLNTIVSYGLPRIYYFGNTFQMSGVGNGLNGTVVDVSGSAIPLDV